MCVFGAHAQVLVLITCLRFRALRVIVTSRCALAGIGITETPRFTHHLSAVSLHVHVGWANVFALIGHAIVSRAHVHGRLRRRADRVDALLAYKAIGVGGARGRVGPAPVEQRGQAEEQQPERCGFHDIKSRDRSLKESGAPYDGELFDT